MFIYLSIFLRITSLHPSCFDFLIRTTISTVKGITITEQHTSIKAFGKNSPINFSMLFLKTKFNDA